MKHFIRKGKMPADKIIDKRIAYHLKKEVPNISVRPDKEFDYSLQGLYERAPDYLVVNHIYGWRFAAKNKKNDYPVLHEFYSTLLNNADDRYRRIAVFQPPNFYMLDPSVPFADDLISVYKRTAGPPLAPGP
ncbi:MAG: hypothetical protein P9M00_08325 [Candidatus Tritonobacter lacicola]|nr:hypothetical protein [Candidatus Tritonobacter lacicola]